MELAVHTQHFQICFRIAGKAEYYGAVHGFEIHWRAVEHFMQLEPQISVRSFGIETTGAIQDLDVAVHRAQIATAVDAPDEYAAINGTDASQQHAIWNVNVVLNRDFD